jgi:hypothetical protein
MKKQIVLTAAIIIAGFAAFSQTCDQRKFHAATTSEIDKLIKLTDGSFTILSVNRLYHVNANGVIVWSKEIPPAGNKSFQGLSFVRLTDGSYIIAGDFEQSAAPQKVMTLVKTDANGNLIWSRQYYDTRLSTAKAIIKTNDAGFVLTGIAREITSNGAFDDAYVMKLDASANIQWTSIIGSVGNSDRGFSIVQTNDNGYAVTGISYINDATDMFVAKVNSAGSLLWSKFFGDGGYDYGREIIETNDGGLAIFGGHGTVPVSGFNYDYFLVKLQNSGALQWAKYYGASDNDYPGSFIQTTDGSYVMTGASYSFRTDNSDCYSIKTNVSGDVQLSKATTGWGKLIFTNGSGYVIGGMDQTAFFYDGLLIKTDNNLSTCNSRNVNTVTQVSTRSVNANFHEESRTFTATALSFTSVNATVSVSQICSNTITSNIVESPTKKENNFRISVYPNPVKDKILLEFTSNELSNAEIKILNIPGNLFFSKNITVYQGANKETINTNFLNKGSYFLSITLRNGDKKSIQFLKE